MAVNDEGANAGTAPGPRGSRVGADLWPRVAAAVAMGLAALLVAWTGGIVFVAFWWVASVVVLWEWQRLVRGERLVERVVVGALALALAALFALHKSVPGAAARRSSSARLARRLVRGSGGADVGGRRRALRWRAGRQPRPSPRGPELRTELRTCRHSLALRGGLGDGRGGLFRRHG